MRTRFSIFCAMLLLLSGCSDIFESSLADKTVSINMPADSLKTQNYSPSFWWNQMDGALQYRIQIVPKSFDSSDVLITDTVVKTDHMTHLLNPGKYQWRIRAENGSSQSKFTTRTLFVVTSALKDQTLQLKSPDDGSTVSNTNTLQLTWNAMPGAGHYRLQIDSTTGNFLGTLAKDILVDVNYYNYSNPVNKKYYWRVRAISAKDTTDYTPYTNYRMVIFKGSN